MTITQNIYHRYQRYRTLHTHRITSLPIVILMPHSTCNCQCIMCDIWKGNHQLKQLTVKDVRKLLVSLESLGTRHVLLSGGEALLNPHFFELCEILKEHNIKITLHSTGLTLARNADKLVNNLNDIIVSLDGHEELHNQIRNIPNAFLKLQQGIKAIREISPRFRISSRSVIHRLNYRHWTDIIDTGIDLGLDCMSFLPADVSSNAFNRPDGWDKSRQDDLLIPLEELGELRCQTDKVIENYIAGHNFQFISESADKLRKIEAYYAAFHGLNPFPYKKCNAPWVSVVIEADGTVRPCFFHEASGNIHSNSLDQILNSQHNIQFRKDLDIARNSICQKCVCSLYLAPTVF